MLWDGEVFLEDMMIQGSSTRLDLSVRRQLCGNKMWGWARGGNQEEVS